MKVLGLGDHVVDVYRNLKEVYPGGNALNVAANAALLHYESAYLGIFGDDIYSDFLLRFLQEKQVDVSMCAYKKNASTKQCVVDIYDGERQFSHVDVKDDWAGVLQLRDEHIAYINSFDAVFTSCNAKMHTQLSLLQSYKGILVYDFGEKKKYREPSFMKHILPYADIVQFSMSDATDSEIEVFANTLPETVVVLITRGSKPTLCYQAGAFISHAQPIVVPVDTMGAGDAYMCAFVTSMMEQGWKKHAGIEANMVLHAMKKACTHAAYICGMKGGFAFPYEGIQAVIFDMDGVLVDSETQWLQLFRLFLQSYGHVLRIEDETRLYGCSKKEEDRILCTYFEQDEAIVHTYKEAFIQKHEFHYHDILMEGCKALLHNLQAKGIRLMLASSSPKENIERMLLECELQPYFECFVSGEQFNESKPNPQIYEYCIDKLQVKKEHIVVVEDSLYGIEAASRAKLQIIQFYQDVQPIQSKSVRCVCDSHQEIWKFIEKNYLEIGESL